MRAFAISVRSAASNVARRAIDFVSAPASPRPLGVLRIGLCSVLILQALAFAASVPELFGERGLVQWPLAELMVTPGVPRIRWLAEAVAPLNISETMCVRGVFVLYVAGLSALLVGWHTRAAAVVAWLTHTMLIMAQRASVYGVDDFTHIALFYCIWFPVGHWGSLDVVAGRVKGEASAAARLALRVLQIHLCLVYLSSGIEKAITPPYQWLDGEVIWRTALLPEFRQFEMTWMADMPWLAMLAAWGSLVIEIGYAVFVWPRRTRKMWALATLGMHLGIAIFMGLASFAAVMMVLTFAAFWMPAEQPTALHSGM